MTAEIVEGFLQVDDVITFVGALDKHVIDVNFLIRVDLVLKALVNQSLVSGSRLF